MRPLAVFALLLLAAPARADEAEDAAVKAVEKLGGKVGRDRTGAVNAVSFYNVKVKDADLKVVVGFKDPTSLDLSYTGVGDSAEDPEPTDREDDRQ